MVYGCFLKRTLVTKDSGGILATIFSGFAFVGLVSILFSVLNQEGLESGFKFTKYLGNLYINSSDD